MATQLKKTVKPSGGDYTSLEACMNDNEQNLVTADQYFDVEISGEWESADTTAVFIHNYTTDATRYINIYTTGDARHSGTAGTGYVCGWSGVTRISVGSQYVTIDGIEIDGGGSTGSSSNMTGILHNTSNITIKNCIFHGWASNTGRAFGYWNNSESTRSGINIYNNIFYNLSSASSAGVYGIHIGLGTKTGNVYSNTIYNLTSASGNAVGITGNFTSSSNIKNNIVVGSTTGDFNFNNATHDYNASSDTTADGANSVTEITSAIFESTTGGSEDLSLKSTATDVIDAGTNLGSPYDEDIIGTARPQGAAWDIGAFEYISAVSTIKRRLLMGCGI